MMPSSEIKPKPVRIITDDLQIAWFEDALRTVPNHIGSPSKYTHLDSSKYHAKSNLMGIVCSHSPSNVVQAAGKSWRRQNSYHPFAVLTKVHGVHRGTITFPHKETAGSFKL
jgi:hypothetical protein